MRKKQKEEEILAALERIEHWQLLTVEKLNKLIKKMEETQEKSPVGMPAADSLTGKGSEWIQEGIDNIMSYQAGKKREGEQ